MKSLQQYINEQQVNESKEYGEMGYCFVINGEDYNVRCWTTKTHNGFCHHATCGTAKARASYMNRTWESYKYQSVMCSLADKLPKEVRAEFKKKVQDGDFEKD